MRVGVRIMCLWYIFGIFISEIQMGPLKIPLVEIVRDDSRSPN